MTEPAVSAFAYSTVLRNFTDFVLLFSLTCIAFCLCMSTFDGSMYEAQLHDQENQPPDLCPVYVGVFKEQNGVQVFQRHCCLT